MTKIDALFVLLHEIDKKPALLAAGDIKKAANLAAEIQQEHALSLKRLEARLDSANVEAAMVRAAVRELAHRTGTYIEGVSNAKGE